MALPRAIQAQVEQAEATLQAMNQPQEPQEQGQGQPPAPAPAPAPTEPPAPAPAPASPPAPESPANMQQLLQQSEHRFRTLQGMFNQRDQQVRDLTARLEEATRKLEEASKRPPEPERPQAPQIDPRDSETFGQDLVEMVQRVSASSLQQATASFQNLAQQFEQRLAQLEQSLQGTTQQVAVTAEEAFYGRLAQKVPNWEQLNTDANFLAWLQEVDPVYGAPRQAALNAAHQRLDSDRVAAVFQAYINAKAPPPAAAPAPNPIDRQVSPRSVTGAEPAPATPQTLTQQEVVQFYDEVRRGAYRGREKEMQRREAEINQAIAEGRVR